MQEFTGPTDETPTVEVVVYQHGAEVHRELCESATAAAEVVEQWSELDDVECTVDDLAADEPFDDEYRPADADAFPASEPF
jgi:hypothetical protein